MTSDNALFADNRLRPPHPRTAWIREEHETQRIRVLLIDDDALDRKLIQRLLGERHVLHAAPDGRSGLEAAAQIHPHCVLLDYRLPDMSGLNVLEHLQSSSDAMAIVVLTGLGSEDTAVEAMKLGAQDYLTKSSLTAAALSHAIDNAVEMVRLKSDLVAQQQEFRHFAYTAAHDLRAPLRKVTGFTRLLLQSKAPGLDDEALDLLGRIDGSVQCLNALVEGLLRYAEVGHTERTKIFPLREAYDGALANIQADIEAKNALLECGELPTVRGNPTALMLLFQNLIANALKFHEFTPRIRIRCERREGDWHLAVQDDGIGIPPKELARIFAPFERLHGKGAYEGSGLGLATCQRIVQAHGGSIHAESELGRGTTIRFNLPALPEAESAVLHPHLGESDR